MSDFGDFDIHPLSTLSKAKLYKIDH